MHATTKFIKYNVFEMSEAILRIIWIQMGISQTRCVVRSREEGGLNVHIKSATKCRFCVCVFLLSFFFGVGGGVKVCQEGFTAL